jgi:aspartate aminotransferase
MPDIRLSQRIQQVAPSATLAMSAKAKALQAAGVDVIAFAAGEPDFDTPRPIKQAACDALAAGDTKYPSPAAGIPGLRAAIRDYLQSYCGLDYTPDQVCVSVGGKDSLFLAFQVLLDPGEEVLIPVPYWVSYPEQVKLAGGKPVFVQPDCGLLASAAAIEAQITPKTRILVLNSPSNPSGEAYTRDELLAIADVIRGTDILVISDEIYQRLILRGEPHTAFAALPGMFDQTITVNGFSKTYAMTGWRLGYAAGPLDVIKAMGRMQGQTTSGPTSFVQTAAITALTGDQSCVDEMAATYRRRCDTMVTALNAMPGVTCRAPRGAFYCFPDVSSAFARLDVKDADGFSQAVLEKAHVALVSGAAFGMPNHVRLSFATSDENIAEGLKRLAALLAS